MKRSVGPLTTLPATKGLTATTGASEAAIASRMPGTARIGPMLITGLEGPITIASAARRASATSAVGRASAIPSSSTPSTSGSPRSTIRYSCSPRTPAAVRTLVRTGSSHIGRTRAVTPSARQICAWASVRRPPSSRNWRR